MATIWIYKDIDKRRKLSNGKYLLGGIIFSDNEGFSVVSDVNWWSIGFISEFIKNNIEESE